MRKSEQVQRDVLDELAFVPDVDSSRIAVTAHDDGVVTLRGEVPSYMQYLAAEKAAKRIRGVRGVANDLEVAPPAPEQGDTGIAEAALRALTASTSIPHENISVLVTRGWLFLEGIVEWEYQRQAALDAVSHLPGVKGVRSHLLIKPEVEVRDIEQRIEAAFRRSAQIDAKAVSVEASGNTVTLTGSVRSLVEKEAAESAAWMGGASIVDNQLTVQARGPA